MRWSVVRLITGKEIRDLLRDRRSVIITVVMPVLLYPIFGATGLIFLRQLLGQDSTVGIVGIEHLTIPQGGEPKLPQLLAESKTSFTKEFVKKEVKEEDDSDKKTEALGVLIVREVGGDADTLLSSKAVDVLLFVPPDFGAALQNGGQPHLRVMYREGDEKSKITTKRLEGILRAWDQKVKEVRYKHPPDDRQFVIDNPQKPDTKEAEAAKEMSDLFARIFPFILAMWVVAGAMQPAVDLTAGEKERGTMETLLISPTNRSEIVLGKFFAVTFFSFAAAVWNAFWLTVCGFGLETVLNHGKALEKHEHIINFPGMIGCVILGLPTAMLFASVAVAFGIFARSTKEGQYYLIPLMLLAMPLAFSTLMPGVELNAGNCFIPVTGALLLQQKMLSVSGQPIPWEYFLPVFGSLALYVAMGLGLAVWQFKRESVLFRETGPARSGRGLFGRLLRRKS
jgi:sodium transport system permease protein